MRLTTITKHTGALILGAGAIVALSTFTGCSSGSTSAPGASAPTTTAAVMPASANFIADMPARSGPSMTTMAIAVEGDKVVAFATNGTNDAAYLFGTQKDGHIELASRYADKLTASFDGTTINGQLIMNEDGATPQRFVASRVPAPAGMYTATQANSRATWVVKADSSIVGVMDNSAPGDHKVTDQIAAEDQQFKDRVRQTRLQLQMQQAPAMTYGTWATSMNATPTIAVPVTGGMTF